MGLLKSKKNNYFYGKGRCFVDNFTSICSIDFFLNSVPLRLVSPENEKVFTQRGHSETVISKTKMRSKQNCQSQK